MQPIHNIKINRLTYLPGNRRRSCRNDKDIELGLESTKALIDMYDSAEILWNKTIPEYRDKKARRRMYATIAKAMGAVLPVGKIWTSDQVKRKIISLRSCYTRCRRMLLKEQEEHGTVGQTFQPWIHYERIRTFMNPTDEERIKRLTSKNSQKPMSHFMEIMPSAALREEDFMNNSNDTASTSTNDAPQPSYLVVNQFLHQDSDSEELPPAKKPAKKLAKKTARVAERQTLTQSPAVETPAAQQVVVSSSSSSSSPFAGYLSGVAERLNLISDPIVQAEVMNEIDNALFRGFMKNQACTSLS